MQCIHEVVPRPPRVTCICSSGGTAARSPAPRGVPARWSAERALPPSTLPLVVQEIRHGPGAGLAGDVERHCGSNDAALERSGEGPGRTMRPAIEALDPEVTGRVQDWARDPRRSTSVEMMEERGGGVDTHLDPQATPDALGHRPRTLSRQRTRARRRRRRAGTAASPNAPDKCKAAAQRRAVAERLPHARHGHANPCALLGASARGRTELVHVGLGTVLAPEPDGALADQVGVVTAPMGRFDSTHSGTRRPCHVFGGTSGRGA